MELKELTRIISEERETLVNNLGILETDKEKVLLRAVKLNEEVGELCEEILKKFGNQRREKKFEEKNLRGEFADVIITTALLADKMEVNLNLALDEKMKSILARRKRE